MIAYKIKLKNSKFCETGSSEPRRQIKFREYFQHVGKFDLNLLSVFLPMDMISVMFRMKLHA